MNRKRKVKVVGTRVIEETFAVRNPRNAVALFMRKHGISPSRVNGRGFVGFCHDTGHTILSGDSFRMRNGVFWLIKEHNLTEGEQLKYYLRETRVVTGDNAGMISFDYEDRDGNPIKD